jgi:hypothetical protein
VTDPASPGEERPLSECEGTALLTVGGLGVSDPYGWPEEARIAAIEAIDRRVGPHLFQPELTLVPRMPMAAGRPSPCAGTSPPATGEEQADCW